MADDLKLIVLIFLAVSAALAYLFRQKLSSLSGLLNFGPKPDEVQNPKFDVNEPYMRLSLDMAQATRGGKNQLVLLLSLHNELEQHVKFHVSKDSLPLLEVYDFRDERRLEPVVEKIPMDERRPLVLRPKKCFAFPHITIFEHLASNLDLTQGGSFHIYNHHQKFVKIPAGVYRVRAVWKDPKIADLQIASNFIELKLKPTKLNTQSKK